MPDQIRIQRLSSLLQRRIAEVLEHELSDPRASLVTITRVKLARDLSTCHVFYSVLGGDGQRNAVQHMLDNATGFIQRESVRVLQTRNTPRLSFHHDPSIAAAVELSSKIDAAIQEDRVRRGLPPEDEDEEDSDSEDSLELDDAEDDELEADESAEH